MIYGSSEVMKTWIGMFWQVVKKQNFNKMNESPSFDFDGWQLRTCCFSQLE